jgi:diguanylate cyclase (GGDEF)-like protein
MSEPLVDEATGERRDAPVDRFFERLTRPLDPGDEDIRPELSRLVLGRISLIWFGALCLAMVALSYVALADRAVGVALLLISVAAIAFRVVTLSGIPPDDQADEKAVRAALTSGLVYTAVIGLVGFACSLSGVPALMLVAGLVLTGLSFGGAFTNSGAPFFAKSQIVMMIAPYILALAASRDPAMLLVMMQGPIWIFGIFMIVNRNHDLSARLIKAQKRDLYLASHDVLTGLSNRSHLMEALDGVRRSRLGGAYLLYLDIDGFKPVNDALGHAVGDELLRIVSKRLRAVMRPEDVIGRIGGDEFVIVVKGLGRDEVRRVADRILEAVRRPVPLGASLAEVSVSVGGAPVGPGDDPKDALAAADAMLYAAKRAGKGQVRLSEEFEDAGPAPRARVGR